MERIRSQDAVGAGGAGGRRTLAIGSLLALALAGLIIAGWLGGRGGTG